MPGLTDLPGSVGTLEQFVAFLADSWHRKDWVRRLMVLEATAFMGQRSRRW